MSARTAGAEPGSATGLGAQCGGAAVPPWTVALPAAAFLAVAAGLMLRGVEPFASWFYIAAWYPTLLLLDAALAARIGRYYLIGRPRFAVSLLAWSAVLWFVFELINFRLANWYYVFLPPARPLRWLGTTVSFATVLPAIFLAERWLAARGSFAGIRWPGFAVDDRLLRNVFLTGIAFCVLTLAWPRYFFPLVWGAMTLLLEPWNYRRDPGRSLLGDLARGRPGRILRLLAGGMAIGFIWEMYNIESRAKWIYTVPFFESFKLFEMPLLGFFGFPIFALDCFVAYQSLVLARVAVPPEVIRGEARLAARRTALAALAATLFAVGVLRGMDRWNTDSLRPRMEDLWLIEPNAAERLAETAYGDVFDLRAAEPREVSSALRVEPERAAEWVAAARLVTLQGIGVDNARLLWELGIRSIASLAAVDPEALSARLRDRAERPRAATPPKVRVWVQAARRSVVSDPQWARDPTRTFPPPGPVSGSTAGHGDSSAGRD